MNTDTSLKPVVSDKPYPVPIEMRPIWRISLIIISIAIVGGDKKYLDAKKVNILVWMLIRRNRWDEYESYLLGESINIPLVSVDTSTYKAVEFAIAKKLTRIEGGRLHITSLGEELFAVLSENLVMVEEMKFLTAFGRKLSESKIKGLTGGLI